MPQEFQGGLKIRDFVVWLDKTPEAKDAFEDFCSKNKIGERAPYKAHDYANRNHTVRHHDFRGPDMGFHDIRHMSDEAVHDLVEKNRHDYEAHLGGD